MTDNDEQLIRKIEKALYDCVGGREKLLSELPMLLRRALDEVIDAPRTGRLTLDEIEKTEKTYIGTKVEILLRDLLGLPKGVLDLEIDGVDVDIKNTIGKTWMIPQEAIGKPCLLVASNENNSTYRFGIIVAHLSNLTGSENRDRKKSVSKTGFKNIHWIAKDQPYPQNFWSTVSKEKIRTILSATTGNERLIRLFREIQEQPINRNIVEAIARQKDYMKRLRKNGGARDKLSGEGIAILSGTFDKELISSMGLPQCRSDEFISFAPKNDQERQALKTNDKIE